MRKASLQQFAAAICTHWFSAMSGAIGVLLAAGGFLVSSDKGKLLLYAASFSALILAFYKAWASERNNAIALQERLDSEVIPLGDMPIRDVFFQRDEGALENEAWLNIGRELQDLLSQGALKAWGRRAGAGGDAPLEEIPKEYWKDARLTYFFFYSEQEVHAEAKVGIYVPNYRDVRLNRKQVLYYWPTPIPRRHSTYNIDAKAAFCLVLHKSIWAHHWQFSEEVAVKMLKDEFRNHLRNGTITAWGKSRRILPLRKIKPEEWDKMQLWVDPPFDEDNTYTTTRADEPGGITTVPMVSVRLCREEILRQYPLRITNLDN